MKKTERKTEIIIECVVLHFGNIYCRLASENL